MDFHLKKELRRDLHCDKFVEREFEQLPVDATPGDGVVVVVTERTLHQAGVAGFPLPGAHL